MRHNSLEKRYNSSYFSGTGKSGKGLNDINAWREINLQRQMRATDARIKRSKTFIA